MRVDDLVDLAALIQQLERLEVGDELDGHDLAVTQPGERDVARHGEREGADRSDFLASLRGAGREQVRVGILQQFVDVGRVASVPVQACAQDSLEFERAIR